MKKLLSTIAALLLLGIPFFALALSPTRIGSDAGAVFASASSWTQAAYNVSSSGTNHVLIVIPMFIGIGDHTRSTSATYNGAAMTEIYGVDGAQESPGVIYCLANPPTGAHDVVVNFSPTNTSGVMFVTTYQDANQDCNSLIDVSQHQSSASSAHPTQSITTTLNSDIVLQWTGSGTAASSHTPDSPQSQISTSQTNANGIGSVSDTPQATAGPITVGTTFGSTNPDDLFVVSFKYAAAAGPTFQLWPLSLF